jgi:hypothetical protein
MKWSGQTRFREESQGQEQGKGRIKKKKAYNIREHGETY